MSRVSCHMSQVPCLFFLTDKVVKQVGGGSVISGATLSSFHRTLHLDMLSIFYFLRQHYIFLVKKVHQTIPMVLLACVVDRQTVGKRKNHMFHFCVSFHASRKGTFISAFVVTF